MVDETLLNRLKSGKNLLAFSGGVDSSALYHILKDKGVEFDIAIVNYQTRIESDEEEGYAKSLAARDKKRCFVHRCKLPVEDFEHKARKERYSFFENLIRKHGYKNLITAHQLDDMLEWGLMQLCKGCGTVEFIGMQPLEEKDEYTLARPLLFTPKSKLLEYLKSHDIKYFIDSSNLSYRHRRNRFRKEAADFLMQECAEGIARSFRYMLKDKEELLKSGKPLFEIEKLTILKKPQSESGAIRLIDKTLKKMGYLLSAAQKDEILKQRSVVVGGEWSVEIEDEKIWIAPYLKAKMEKEFKELCRSLKIPPKIRPYLYSIGADVELLSRL